MPSIKSILILSLILIAFPQRSLAACDTLTFELSDGPAANYGVPEDMLRLTITDKSLKEFSKFTKRHLKKSADVVLDGKLLSSVIIQEVIESPNMFIAMPARMSHAQREALIRRLVAGDSKLKMRSCDL